MERKMYPLDLTGLTFGRLTVLGVYELAENVTNTRWKCVCSCNNHNIVYPTRKSLISGTTRSCGCLAREARKKPNSGQYQPIDHNDIVGQKFGKLTVLGIDHNVGRHYYYKCSCDCGRDDNVVKERSNFLNNINLQCNQCYKDELANKAANELIGQKFGRLTVLELDHIGTRNTKGHNSFIYKCRCDCKEDRIVLVDKYALTSGKTRSCGCLAREVASERQTTHGMSGTRFYKEWDGIVQRTSNPNCDSYSQYGGRGIAMCDRWRNSFENFKEDMYESYLKHVEEYGESETTIERIDVNGNYEPSNCTWATRAEQNRNMTTNFRLIYNGQEYICADLWRMFCPNMSYNEFNHRLKKYGYSSGDIIDNTTCYDTIFKGTHITQAIEFINKDEKGPR